MPSGRSSTAIRNTPTPCRRSPIVSWSRRLTPRFKSASRRNRFVREVLFARVSRSDDDADGLLVKPFEAAVALEVFEMTAQGPFFDELIELRLGDEARRQKTLGPLAAHRPALAFGEGLAEKLEIGEGFHRVDATFLQLIAEDIEIKPRFKKIGRA